MSCHIRVLSGQVLYFDKGGYPTPYLLEVTFTYDGTVATMQGLSHPKFTWQIGRAIVRHMKAHGYARVRWERKDENGVHLRWVEF